MDQRPHLVTAAGDLPVTPQGGTQLERAGDGEPGGAWLSDAHDRFGRYSAGESHADDGAQCAGVQGDGQRVGTLTAHPDQRGAEREQAEAVAGAGEAWTDQRPLGEHATQEVHGGTIKGERAATGTESPPYYI